MKTLEQLELVDVKYEESRAILTFLDEESGEIREVSFNKKIYSDGKWVEDEEKAKKVDEWCQTYFNLTFENLTMAVGDRKDIYCYDRFNSLWEVAQVSKFDEDMVGQILSVVVTEVIDDGKAIKIRFEYEDATYESKMNYSKFLESRNEFFVDAQLRTKKYEKFQEKFHISIENKVGLVGKSVMVEVKKWAFGGKVGTWVDVKPFPKKKK
jgi:hypothetical protein